MVWGGFVFMPQYFVTKYKSLIGCRHAAATPDKDCGGL